VAPPAAKNEPQPAADEPVAVAASTTETLQEPAAVVSVVAEPSAEARVLAGALIPLGELQVPPLFTPLQLSKALFLSLIMLIIATLLYDSLVIGNRQTMRLVGQNLAHILFFGMIAFLLILFKGGIVG